LFPAQPERAQIFAQGPASAAEHHPDAGSSKPPKAIKDRKEKGVNNDEAWNFSVSTNK